METMKIPACSHFIVSIKFFVTRMSNRYANSRLNGRLLAHPMVGNTGLHFPLAYPPHHRRVQTLRTVLPDLRARRRQR